LTSETGRLFRQEVELAKTEAREEVRRAAKGIGMLLASGATALLAALMLSMALAWLLDKAVDRAVAFLIVGALWAVTAAILASAGRKKAAEARPLPETVQTLKEDAQWVKAQTS
jgi:F0F1-type ATP synthase assembly protein I